MKSFKKIIAYSLALTLSVSGSAFFSVNSKNIRNTVFAENTQSDGWEYTIYDKIDGISSSPCIEITKYCGEESIVDIPAEIKGYPVISVAGKPFSGNSKTYDINIPSSIKRFEDGFLDDSNIVFLTFNNLKFCIENEKKLTLVSYEANENESDVDIEVPSSLAGYTVTALWNYVFSDNKTIKSVKLPDTINYFGMNAFMNSAIEKINIPKSLKIIPSNTFNGCSSLSDVELNGNINVIIAQNAFKDAPVILPESALSYKAGFCSNSFDRVTVDKNNFKYTISYNKDSKNYSVTVDKYVPDLSDSNKKIDVEIPGQVFGLPVIKTGDYFWDDCNSSGIILNSIIFPSEIQEIRAFTLDSPSELKSVTIDAKNITIERNMFENTGIEEISLHGSCNIEEKSFSECEHHKKITIPGDSENIKIANQAFLNCTALEEIIFPDNSDVVINTMAFRNCISLKNFTINGNAAIMANAFRDCDNLETISISGNAQLSTNAFLDNKALTNIFVNTNNTLDGSAFNGCSNLMSINSITAFNNQSNALAPKLENFILNNFNGAENVGFINLYIQSQADKIVSEYTNDNMSDIQKAKVLHDWICNKVYFEHEDPDSPKTQNDGSVFMNNSTICEGYAKGYDLLLKAAGIESHYVHSSSHAWNIIKLGNQYFHVDTTWDDGDNISYEWFLKSDSEISSETSSHSKWSVAMLSPLHNSDDNLFLPECKYSMGDINTDGKTNVADLVILNRYILGKDQLDSDNYIFSDLNFDGTTDSFDMISMRKLILNN